MTNLLSVLLFILIAVVLLKIAAAVLGVLVGIGIIMTLIWGFTGTGPGEEPDCCDDDYP